MSYYKIAQKTLSGFIELVKDAFNQNPNTDIRVGHLTQSVDFGVTANAGSTQATGYAISSIWTEIGTCATAGDSLTLPVVKTPGMMFHVVNHGAESADVFPPVGGNIDGAGANTANALAAAASRIYMLETYNSSTGATTWVTF